MARIGVGAAVKEAHIADSLAIDLYSSWYGSDWQVLAACLEQLFVFEIKTLYVGLEEVCVLLAS